MPDQSPWPNRIVAHGELDPESILANESNWRVHPKPQQEALAGILSDVGLVQSVIINRRTSELWPEGRRNVETLVDGHLRVGLALSAHQPRLPVVYVDLTPAEEAEVLATLDPVGALAVADKEQLDALLREVSTGEAAVQEMLAELAKGAGLEYGQEPKPAPEAQIDRAAELQEKWKTALGQLWEIPSQSTQGKAHRLLCGDSTHPANIARVVGAQAVRAVVFDPPFDAGADVLGVRYSCLDSLVFSDHRHLLDCVAGWGRYRSAFVWDGVTSWYVPGQPLARGKFCLWFGESDYNADGAHYGESGQAHTVTNTRGSYHYKPDPRGKHLSTVFTFQNTALAGGGSHEKPLGWVRCLLGNCTSGDILDLFTGWGTVMAASEQLGRLCCALEIEPARVAVCLERMVGMGLNPQRLN